jgi:hypothetical protein
VTGLELLALASGLTNLANKVIAANREATEAEVDEALAGAHGAIDSLDAAIARKKARDAAAGGD